MDLSLDMRLQQKISPQMIQAMDILQLGTQELLEYIEQALLENPVLETDSTKCLDEQARIMHTAEWLASDDRQNRSYYKDDIFDPTELATAYTGETLYDHLCDQVDFSKLSMPMVKAVECVIYGLNQNGYLEETDEELALRCGQSQEYIRRAVDLVRSLEPAGIAARTLSECLCLQLQREGQTGVAMTIAQRFLEDVAHNHYHRISKETGASRESVSQACVLIKQLNPKPGGAFAKPETPNYISPDILVLERQGSLDVSLQDSYLPTLAINNYYQELMNETKEADVRDYLAERFHKAEWLIRSIDQRKNTLLDCARVIAQKQEGFFVHGAGELVPLTLNDVANELRIHESTVSRAIRGKYLQCKHGVLPLSWFFSRALTGGDGVSAEKAKEVIRQLIDGENRRRPLSDQKLCELLANQEIVLSRRTVAKYRDELGIPSTQGRKELYMK